MMSPSSSSRLITLFLSSRESKGQFVAEYLAQKLPNSFIIASNHQDFMDRIIDRTGVKIPSILVDLHDRTSLELVVKNTKVVLAASDQYGATLVDVCVRNGVHYLDVNEDCAWIAESIKRYNDLAMKNNVLIVHSCGSVSMPSDLGNFFLVDYIKKKYEVGVKKVVGSLQLHTNCIGSFLNHLYRVLKNSKNSSVYSDPYSLNPLTDKEYPPNGTVHALDSHSILPSYDSSLKLYNCTGLFAQTSERIVRRSGRLYNQAGFKYGRDFHYSQFTSTKSILGALLEIILYLIFILSFYIPPILVLLKKLIWLLSKVFPAQSSDKDWFRINLSGEIEGKNTKVIRATISGGDLFYKETAKMIAESGIILALQDKQLKVKGGVVTPAFAFGSILIERLHKSGIQFQITEDS